MSSPDTIAAIASAPGRAAVGVVRVSGTRVPQIAAAILGRLPAPRRASLATFLDAQGRSVDEGLALYFPAPDSYTGEDVLELQGHGGMIVVDQVLKRLLELGCRLARPGEFSERAFLNGKIDIAQAEAIADLIEAGTAAAARAALRSLQGEFSDQVTDLKNRITHLRVYVEAAIDFPDEEIDFLSDTALHGRLAAVFQSFEAITVAAHQGALLREGLTVVIAGKPNAGKSSLLNRLAGDEVAIVADVPGTTRDVLRQRVHLDGLPLNLVDTAGLRPSADAVEAEGVRRAMSEIARADRVLYVVDACLAAAGDSEAVTDLEPLPAGIPVTLVFNKIDLTGTPARVDEAAAPHRVFLSARTGAGIELLRSYLKSTAGYLNESGAFGARRRHVDALNRARHHVQKAADTLKGTRAIELFAEDLRLAQAALGEITGEFTSENLLGEIFGSFCIGK
ncbi:MAG: tRNA uridine-5-carboxymethylaminomethyl(34) synthesis GTPase MnmE [Steroidobacteraceae bacterium]